MIALLVDEAYAFDYLAILHVKCKLQGSSSVSYDGVLSHLSLQLGIETITRILESPQYSDMIDANLKVFDAVSRAKRDEVSASYVDKCNYDRYVAKQNLQKTFFSEGLSEIKIGYEVYNK